MINPRKYLLFKAGRGAVSAQEYGKTLERKVETSLAGWHRFTRAALLALGLGLVAAGIIFLLAFNWSALNKWQQLGVAAAGVAAPALLALTNLISAYNRKMLVTVAAFMVGGLFAVFGQIYQTGADNYEYFLAWFLFTTIWAVAVDFPGLWLIWVTAANLTLYFFGEQVLTHWRTHETLGVQVIFTGFVLVALSFHNRRRAEPYPTWFLNAVALGLSVLAFIAILLTTWQDDPDSLYYLVRFGVLAIVVGSIYAGYRLRWLGLMATMSLAFISCVAVLVVSVNVDTGPILLAALWVLGATTGAGIALNLLRKSWLDDEEGGAGAGAKTVGSAPERSSEITDRTPQLPDFSEDESNLRLEYLAKERERSPVGLQLLSLFGGILAMLAILGVIGIAGGMNSGTSRAIVGLVFLAGGLFLDRGEHGDFIDAILVAAISVGLLMLISAPMESWSDGRHHTFCLIGGLLCAGVLVLARSQVVRALMVVGIHVAIIAALLGPNVEHPYLMPRLYVLLTGLFLAYWMLRERYIATVSPFLAGRFEAVRAGTLVALLIGSLTVRWAGYFSASEEFYYVYGFPIVELLVVAAVYVGYLVIRRYVSDSSTVVLYPLGLALLLFPFSFAPAAAPALLVIMLSVKTGYRLGAVLGASSLLYFLGQYYYDLNTTLFEKSLILAGTGIFYLLAYALIHNKLHAHETTD